MYLQVFEIGSADDLVALDWFTQLRQSPWGSSEAAQTVSQIIKEVAAEGDRAVVRYMQKWTDPDFDSTKIRVPSQPMVEALRELSPSLREAVKTSINNVQTYQQHIRPADVDPIWVGDARVGLRYTPVPSVGLLVPGGRAAYPSTVIMLAVPAMVAGVKPEQISVITPPPTRAKPSDEPADVSNVVLAVCALLGISRVYRVGGAQGVAALAIGTKSVQPVDMIVGPGNVYTQLAKQQLAGRMGIDGFYGPSEILTIADGTANPALVAADLIAQAEHDPGRCFLVTWSHKVMGQINQQIKKQLDGRNRRAAIVTSLQRSSAALLVRSEAMAADVANQLAAEHVSLAVADPHAWLKRIAHAGQFFLSDRSPVAAGDYVAGPSHCLPTGTTPRFASGISVHTFLKRSGTIDYSKGISRSVIESASKLAMAEGLDGHAASMMARLKN